MDIPQRPSAAIGATSSCGRRDRNGTFEPKMIGKHQRRLAGFDDKILALYAKEMTTRDIQEIVKELKYTTEKDRREVATDLMTIYQSEMVLKAEQALDAFDAKWGEKYPTIVKQWWLHWCDIIAMFEFPQAIRKAIYTTNAIESVNSVIRTFTWNRKQYPNADSALKLLYLAIPEASRSGRCPSSAGRRR